MLGEEVELMSHDTLGVVRSSAAAGTNHSGQRPGSSVSLISFLSLVVCFVFFSPFSSCLCLLDYHSAESSSGYFCILPSPSATLPQCLCLAIV